MIHTILLLMVLGFIVYLIENYAPMTGIIRDVIRFIVLICVIVLLLDLIGVVSAPIPWR